MIKCSAFFLYFSAASALLFGQLDSNSVTVTATRNLSVQPDQAIIELSVISPLDATLDSVVAVLQGFSVSAADFNAVGIYPPAYYLPQPGQTVTQMMQWGFGIAVPVTKLKDTLAALTALEQTIAKKNNGFTLSFSVQGLTLSPQLQQSQVCKTPDLIADARAQAQKFADASGMAVGSILAISGATSTTVGSAPPVASSSGLISYSVPTYPAPCSAVVKFALTRF